MSRVLVAMSGGVDSSVAAYLLRQAGHDCVGATMMLARNSTCCRMEDAIDAKAVCLALGIPHYTFDLTREFDEAVVGPFCRAYDDGLTPNPCVQCNRHLKFGLLWRRAQALGCDAIATGHYARVGRDACGRPTLMRGLFDRKDQSYVLWPVSSEVLAHLLLPLGDFASKDEVRAIAERQGFSCARKHDSQDICFVPDGDYAGFVERHRGHASEPGHIVDADGRVLGWHHGIERYTIGQRKGLGIACGRPMYVVEKDASTNTVRVGDDRELFSATFGAVDAVWPSGAVDGPVACDAVVCYHGRRHPAHVTRTGDREFRVDCERPVRAIAPGQSVVCYDGDRVVCGGVIAAGVPDAPVPDAAAGREATPFSAARGQAATDHSDDGGM